MSTLHEIACSRIAVLGIVVSIYLAIPGYLAGDQGSGETFKITRVEITGDADVIDALKLRPLIEADTVGKSLSRAAMLDLATKYQERCVSEGLYLALIALPPTDYSKGVLVYAVDKGRFGNISLYDRVAGERYRELKQPFSQRYFDDKQIRRRLKRLKSGDAFDYNTFYRAVFSINSHPDLTLDSDLRIRKEFTDRQLRYADMDLYIKDSLPLHGVFEISNRGTEATDEWRTAVTLQHLNITRHDDILSFNAFSSLDFEKMLSVAGSYYMPHSFWNGGSFTIYGGYSEVEAGEIVPFIDLLGTGWFVGLQTSYKPSTSEKHLLSISVGGLCRFLQNTLLVDPCEDAASVADTSPSDVMIIPVSLTVSYSSGKPDRLGGRNFLTSRTSFNLGRFLGASDDEELANQREDAKADYFVQRLRVARIQPLFGRTSGRSKRGQWTLFAKIDGQYSNTSLVPAEQKTIGGMDTVRGYPERIALGDNGISAVAELRTPILPGLLARFASRNAESDTKKGSGDTDHLQFVAFFDGGYVAAKESGTGADDSITLASAGFGLRLALKEHVQFKFDWGVPLKEVADTGTEGRGHLSLQLQF